MNHSFDIELATEIGLVDSIVLQHIGFWIKRNAANRKNWQDGHFWTYNSRKAFTEMFPYITDRTMRSCLERLQAKGLVITANYNKKQFDRTLWYTITEKGAKLLKITIWQNDKCNCQKGQCNCQNDKPIPDVNTDVNTDKRKDKRVSAKNGHARASSLSRPKEIEKQRITDSPYFAMSEYAVKKIKETHSHLNFTHGQLILFAIEFEKMCRLDKRSKTQIAEVLDWLPNSPVSDNGFSWRYQVRSPMKFRRRDKDGIMYFDRLLTDMIQDKKPKAMTPTQKRNKMYKDVIDGKVSIT